MNVAVICGYPFPSGLAPTSRILAYAKGLKQSGAAVSVFIFFPRFAHTANQADSGNLDGIRYFYPKMNGWSKNRIARVLFDRIRALILTCRNIADFHKNHTLTHAIISNDVLPTMGLFIIFMKLLGVKVLFITDEYPPPIRTKAKSDITILQKKLFAFFLQFTDGMIFMTNKLLEFYNKLIAKPSFVMPTIIDLDRFAYKDVPKPVTSEREYLCYMGNMELAKDNVDNIIRAFENVCKDYPLLDLHLYGQPNQQDKKFLENLIAELQLTTRVFLKGRIEASEVPAVLHGAKILVSSQPDTKRAEGGFPTKLGEYLATGRPVLFTNVGEIPLYLKDMVTGFICPPDDCRAYADKLRIILDNPMLAEEAGAEGKKYLQSEFDCGSIGKKLKDFIETV